MEAYGNRSEMRFMQAWELIREIHEHIPGEKIISIATEGSREFDMNASGKIGYDDMQKLMCLHTITGAIKNGGTLCIKQFLPLYSVSKSPEIRTYEILFQDGACSTIQAVSESSIMEKELMMRDSTYDIVQHAKKRSIERKDADSSCL